MSTPYVTHPYALKLRSQESAGSIGGTKPSSSYLPFKTITSFISLPVQFVTCIDLICWGCMPKYFGDIMIKSKFPG